MKHLYLLAGTVALLLGVDAGAQANLNLMSAARQHDAGAQARVNLMSATRLYDAGAPAKLDLMSAARLRDARLGTVLPGRVDESRPLLKRGPATHGSVQAFITLSPDSDISSLESEGVAVQSVIGNVVLCTLPLADVERIASLDCVRKVSVDRPRALASARAREVSGIDAIHEGAELSRPYTGKGVICGIYDSGVDPNHVNFLAEDGSSRVKWLQHLRLSGAGTPVFSDYDASNVRLFTTDEPSTYHGTHTLGIMAGSYRGTVSDGRDYVPYPGWEGPTNRHYGMAPEADIAVACGATSDYFIANGINNIIDYALERRRPCVINMSLGGAFGAHDPNSPMGSILSELGKWAVIVMAAGNEGNIPLHASKTFTADDTELKTMIRAYWRPEETGNLRYGQVGIYSDDETPFEIQAVVVNRRRGTIAYRIPLPEPGSGTASYHVSSSEFASGSTDVVSPALAKYFNGYIGIGSAIDPDTGRFYAIMDYYTTDTDDNADDNYVPGFIITGTEGQTARAWCDASWTQLDDYGLQGWDAGTTDGSISDMATAHNVVVVGSYNTTGEMLGIDGRTEYFEPDLGAFLPGEITCFSAYGTLADGRTLPHVCAPGATLVSSTSRYYVEDEANEVDTDRLSAFTRDASGVTHWWSQTGGTSMATPVVSGAIALWLEANPRLTVWDVLGIIERTSRVDEQVTGAAIRAQWGAGKFDAYAGLKEALRMSGVESVGTDTGESPLLVRHMGGDIEFSLPGTGGLDLEIYTVSGALVHRVRSAADEVTIPASAFASGLYVARAAGRSAKFIIK